MGWFDGALFLRLSLSIYLPFSLCCVHCHLCLCLHLSYISPTCGNHYAEFGRGMYVLNPNRSLKVEDSGSPLSWNAVKVSFQIKKDLFDLPNIVFSPSGNWKWWMLSLISFPAFCFLTHAYTNTHGCSILWSVLWSGQVSEQGAWAIEI